MQEGHLTAHPSKLGQTCELYQVYFPARSEDDDDDDEDDDSSDDDLDGVVPVTGFAVASNKRTADFHAMFPTIPEADYLIDDYGCALQRDILLQGRLYVSENHVCFHANIFGWTTDLIIPIDEITSVEKKMPAYVIPTRSK
ncbi:hypothetical protein M422DRAFT_271069 [Sphaerobolus stellatus SS14]|uniref:GRAM domain-containing protein n=1 Tax=Sphaerobolus stellatus (strain SS14) TaxID=990650 RepID=A0A0C9UFB3_SPHS4|nr:hypothetical protein M422DRAFT_271069 [Sphaerobolus stellatus SS14]